MHRRRFAYASVVVLVALLSGACTGGGTPTPGITSSITAPTPVTPQPPTSMSGDLGVSLLSANPRPGNDVNIVSPQTQVDIRAAIWCKPNTEFGVVYLRVDGQMYAERTWYNCPEPKPEDHVVVVGGYVYYSDLGFGGYNLANRQDGLFQFVRQGTVTAEFASVDKGNWGKKELTNIYPGSLHIQFRLE